MKRCVCLFIADDYEFMDASLIELLREKMRGHFHRQKNEQQSNEGIKVGLGLASLLCFFVVKI